jgi:hypothetical protein
MVRRLSIFQLILTFFGPIYNNPQQSRLSLFNQIHEIVFHGKGGYDYNTIYNMPIWLRNFTFNKIKEWYNPQNDTNDSSWVESSEIKQEASKNKKIQPPSYVTKASKK